MKASDIIILQILFHLIGDYITQSDWMAENKTKNTWAAMAHAMVYSLPFCIIAPDLNARLVIFGTHLLIDRFRLAVYATYIKNISLDPRCWRMLWYVPGKKPMDDAAYDRLQRLYDWENCKATGYPSQKPPWLAFWLLIIADNTMHLAINFLAIRLL